MLRAHRFEARARCGFGACFSPGRYEDHWVVEFRDGDRWRLADAQIDGLQRAALGLTFDPPDVPRDQFLTGLTGLDAWHGSRPGTSRCPFPIRFSTSGAERPNRSDERPSGLPIGA